jgi:hypothetical protein
MVPFPTPRKCAALAIALALTGLAACQQSNNPASAPAAEATPAAAAAAAPSPITPNSFTEVTAQLDTGGELYLYLSTEQWLTKLSHGVDVLHDVTTQNEQNASPDQIATADKAFALGKDIIHKSGLEEISGVGVSSFNYAPGLYRNKIFFHHYPANGNGLIWSLYGKTPHPLTAMNLLPADTAAAGFGDWDLPQLINFLRTEADQSGIPEFKQAVDQWQTQFAGVSGLQLDDVLNSLNGSVGMILTLDATNVVSIPVGQQPQTIPAPRLAFLIAVKNDLIFKQVDKMLTGNPGVVKTEEPGLSMRTMPLPFILPTLNLRPSFAQWNGYFVIASDDTVIRNIIAADKGGPGFKSTAAYAKYSAGLPDQGNAFSVITQQFADTMQKFYTQLYAAQVQVNPTAGPKMQQFLNRYQHTGPLMAVGTVLPNGWLSVSQGRQGSSQLIAPVIIAPAAVLAGVAVPLYNQRVHPSQPSFAPPPTSSAPGAMNPSPNPNPGTSP